MFWVRPGVWAMFPTVIQPAPPTMKTFPIVAVACAALCSSVYGQTLITQTRTFSGLPDQVGSLSYNSGLETATTPVNVDGFITVTYTVPEPSSSALLGLAAIGLAFRRRRA